MRLTASNAIGEIGVAVLLRRALAAMSAKRKLNAHQNLRRLARQPRAPFDLSIVKRTASCCEQMLHDEPRQKTR
jgi:hypothetical protein